MSTLEDQILKQNIPGKYSWWEKDTDEAGPKARAEWFDPDASDPEQELTELEKQKKWVEADCPDPVRRTIMARAEKERARTGVKGVLADHAAYQASEMADHQLQQQYRAAALQRMAGGHVVANSAPHFVPKTDPDAEDGDDDEDGDLNDFLSEYRKQRLLELQASAHRPIFGQIQEASRGDFVEQVDNVDPRCYVVVHLYEPYIKACQAMNRHLEVLAREYPSVKFLRMLSGDVSGGDEEGYDPVALPTLMVYRAKEIVACFTRVTDDLGDTFTKSDVEWLLQEINIFEAVAPQQAQKQQGQV
ncbi:thioredoxin-like protein [Tribonema minus]|uniref:Thioredoxin-like protein n=1 Tax=Tribonema minus TaxID=303371 RepID=A0A835YKQ5_9STRA|nr:thioredoxin-like protein [Tribonema minus]